MAAITATLLVSYVKARAEGLGGSCKTGLMTRAPRVIYLMAWAVLLTLLPASRAAILWSGLAVYTALTILTVIQRIVHVKRKGLAG
jgi:CDP-diacylglycerol--glycerol-3-phosphate 3-phosphatidyltransferase